MKEIWIHSLVWLCDAPSAPWNLCLVEYTHCWVFGVVQLCLFIDLIGMSSYLLPVVGEAGDFAWAPIEAYLLMTMFGSNAIAGFGFIEEALPGLDFIPTATIAWFIENNPNLAGVKKALFPKQ